MKTIQIDCGAVESAEDFWEAYLLAAQPEGGDLFGRNMAAFRDALLAGGPGWPGEARLAVVNTAGIKPLQGGKFYAALKELSNESRFVHLVVE